MYCKRCGKEIPDGDRFCAYCGEAANLNDLQDYPKIKEDLNDNEIFNSVYYGPDYYKDKDKDEGLKTYEKKKGLRKLTDWLFRKNNKS